LGKVARSRKESAGTLHDSSGNLRALPAVSQELGRRAQHPTEMQLIMSRMFDDKGYHARYMRVKTFLKFPLGTRSRYPLLRVE